MYSPRHDRQLVMPIWIGEPATLLQHSRIAILFATYGGTPSLAEALLEWKDGSCTYRSPSDAALVNNQAVELVRDANCRADPARPADLLLTVRLKERGERVAVWTFVPPPGSAMPPDLVRAWAGDPGTQPAGIVRGSYLELDGPAPRRLALFNYVWNVAADPRWIWLTLAVAAALAGASVLLLAGRFQVAAVGALALALGFLYAAFVPPLEAPDEPAHLLAFANSTGRTGMASSAETLARRGHLQRLRFHGDERFRARDVGHPWPEAWTSEVFAHDVEGRSLTTFWWWKAAGGMTRELTTPRTLLAARLGNAVLFALTMALITAMMGSLTPAGVERLPLPMILLAVPTLPFFGTSLSEFALLTDAYLLFAASICLLLADVPRADRAGLPLGVAISLALLSGRSAAPILPLFGAAVAGRALLGQRDPSSRSTALFWCGCAAGLALFPLFVTPAFSAGLWPGDARPDARFRQVAELLRTHPAILLAPIPIGWAVEWLLDRVRRGRTTARGGAARVIGYATAGAIALSLAGSLVIRYPILATRETDMPANALAYTGRVLRVASTSFRVTNPDLLLSTSFWGGFGWIDAVLPTGIVVLLILAMAMGLILTGWTIARRENIRQAGWLILLAAGGAASLVAYAVSNYFLNRNLHGRYLIGLYLSAILAAWTIPLLWRDRAAGPARATIIAAVVVVHAYALPFVLLRYF